MKETTSKTYSLKEKFASLGPGILIVGSFIGPGTVTSATRAGANYGFALLWCIIFSVVAVSVLQEMAARLGVVKQAGLCEVMLGEVTGNNALRWALILIVAVPIVLGGFAYMGGDLTGTALGLSAITGVSTKIIAPVWGICIMLITTFAGNALKQLEKLLGICVTIMAVVFVVTMIIVKPDLGELFSGLVPTVPDGAMLTCVSLIGTTVVPYNLFLHAASSSRTWHNTDELPLVRFGTIVPMIMGGIVTGAVLITSSTVMRGMTINNAMDMAVQLEPTLGSFAQPFMSIGLIAAGVSSAVCTPLGVSYVLAGLFGWKTDRSDKRYAITNYVVLIFGILIAASGFNPIAIIMAAQAVNGVFLPVSVGVVVWLTSRSSVMGKYKNSILSTVLGVGVFIISLIIGVNSVISLF